MNISIYTSADFPSGGAAENYIRQMAIGLHECDANIKVVRIRGRTYGGENYTNISCSNLLFKMRPNNEILKLIELLLISLYIPLSVIIHKYRYDVNVIILDGVDYPYYSLPFLIPSKILKIKLLRIIGDFYDTKNLSPVWWKFPKVYFYNIQFRFIDKYFTGIIVFSDYLKNIEQQNGVKNEHVILIPHFIDIQWFVDCECKPEQVDGKIIIGFCGTPNIANGMLDLLDSFRIVHERFKNIELLIIGQPTYEVILAINECLNSIKCAAIRYTGHISKDAVRDQLNSCTMLVNPRRSGRLAEAGFPTKLGEYFASRKAVISTLTGDAKEYFINKQELIFAEPNNPNSLVDAMVYLIENQNEANIIANNGYNWAKSNLDYFHNSKMLLIFLQRL